MKAVSVQVSIGKTVLYCEICGRGPAEEGSWTLCLDCSQLLRTMFQFLRQNDVDPKDLNFLKEILRSEARGIGLTN